MTSHLDLRFIIVHFRLPPSITALVIHNDNVTVAGLALYQISLKVDFRLRFVQLNVAAERKTRRAVWKRLKSTLSPPVGRRTTERRNRTRRKKVNKDVYRYKMWRQWERQGGCLGRIQDQIPLDKIPPGRGIMPKKLLVRNIHQLYYTAYSAFVGSSSLVRLSVRYNKLGFILHSAVR